MVRFKNLEIILERRTREKKKAQNDYPSNKRNLLNIGKRKFIDRTITYMYVCVIGHYM